MAYSLFTGPLVNTLAIGDTITDLVGAIQPDYCGPRHYSVQGGDTLFATVLIDDLTVESDDITLDATTESFTLEMVLRKDLTTETLPLECPASIDFTCTVTDTVFSPLPATGATYEYEIGFTPSHFIELPSVTTVIQNPPCEKIVYEEWEWSDGVNPMTAYEKTSALFIPFLIFDGWSNFEVTTLDPAHVGTHTIT